MINSSNCILCNHQNLHLFHQDKSRKYYRCNHCKLVQVPKFYHLSLEEEKKRYDLHENQIDDPQYRNFLSQLSSRLIPLLPQGAKGFDFGCGPGPGLADILKKAGFEMDIFDPFYYPDKLYLTKKYNFITSTEVVEHLAKPGREIEKLWNLLLPQGHLAIMTGMVINKARFKNWSYIRDLSHICFFSLETFDWLTHHLGGKLILSTQNVVILKKPIISPRT
ncbi:MAG: class I SAM-dependent methyltransferase [Myxococcota bacterium]